MKEMKKIEEIAVAPLTLKEKYSFGIGAFGENILIGFVGTFLMYFYTDMLYISPAFIGLLFFFSRIWDAVNDPIMGLIVDNTSSKFGKIKLWLAIGVLSNAAIVMLLFQQFNLSGTALLIYVSITYVLFGMTYTMMDIPFWSWLPNLTITRKERDSMSVIPRMFASLAALIIASTGLQLVAFLGKGNEALGFKYGAYLVSIVLIVTMFVTLKNVPETRRVDPVRKEKTTLKKMYQIIAHNGQLQAYILFFVLFNMGIQVVNSFMLYYFKYAIGSEAFFSIYILTILAEILGLSLFPWVAEKIGRKYTYLLACMLTILGLLSLFLTGLYAPTSLFLVLLSGTIQKVGVGFAVGIATVALADCVDYSESLTGERHESIIASTQTFSVKVGMAVAGLFIGFGLDLLHYQPGATQLASTVLGIRIMTCLIPVVFILASLGIYMKFYKIK